MQAGGHKIVRHIVKGGGHEIGQHINRRGCEIAGTFEPQISNHPPIENDCLFT